jgi:serine/threonine protein kinase
MSSLWGFSTNASTSSYLHRVDIDTDVVDVLSVLHECLPQIPPRYLSRDKSVGIGSLFHVRREIYDEQNDPPLQYYVAVKYIRVDQKAEIRRQASRALLRELRAIMHPRLRGHPHIISAFGYGWTESISEDSNLFLVMEYANFGTLSDLLQATNLQRSITVPERHHLVLETACGLQALHECGIIHGDLKASNVLVFSRSFPLGYTSDVQDIAWAVKIADFGSSISQIEADQRVFRYTGTAVYNAPEIESTATSGFTNSGSFIQYKSADVYSFGLLLWEVMKSGRFYMDCIDNQGRAIKQRDRLEFLKKIHESSDDAMLETALRSLEDVRIEILDLGLRDIWESISTVLSYCLQKPFAARKSATMVYEKLRSCTR